jgi:hypothetical protein
MILDLFDVVRSCLRRWYVLLPLLLFTIWFSHHRYVEVKPVYYSNTVLGIAPPSARVEQAPAGVPLLRNGLMDAGGAAMIANMTTIGLRDPSVVDQVVAAGGGNYYTAKMFPVPATVVQPPLIMLDVTAADPASAKLTLQLVTAQAGVTLKKLQQQAGVPDDQMVSMFVVSPPVPPQAGIPSRTKSVITMLVAGIGFAVLAAVLADLLLTRLSRLLTRLWRRRKSRRRQRPSEAAPESAPPPNGTHEPSPPVSVAEDVMEAR